MRNGLGDRRGGARRVGCWTRRSRGVPAAVSVSRFSSQCVAVARGGWQKCWQEASLLQCTRGAAGGGGGEGDRALLDLPSTQSSPPIAAAFIRLLSARACAEDTQTQSHETREGRCPLDPRSQGETHEGERRCAHDPSFLSAGSSSAVGNDAVSTSSESRGTSTTQRPRLTQKHTKSEHVTIVQALKD